MVKNTYSNIMELYGSRKYYSDNKLGIYKKPSAVFSSQIKLNQCITYLQNLAPMAINGFFVAFFFIMTLALAKADEPYESQLLKGSVTCVDCPRDFDLSGVQVLVKCDKVKKLAVTYTQEDGTFVTELPSDGPIKSTTPLNCMAKIMGSPHQLYISTKDSLTPVIANARESSGRFFTTAKPLVFYNTCPLKGKCVAKDNGFASSKTVDFPLPREWGLAPSSYYIPFIPIIGIP